MELEGFPGVLMNQQYDMQPESFRFGNFETCVRAKRVSTTCVVWLCSVECGSIAILS